MGSRLYCVDWQPVLCNCSLRKFAMQVIHRRQAWLPCVCIVFVAEGCKLYCVDVITVLSNTSIRGTTVSFDRLWARKCWFMYSCSCCLFICCIFVVQGIFTCVYCYNQWSVLRHVCSPHPMRVLWFEARLPKRLMTIRVIVLAFGLSIRCYSPFWGCEPAGSTSQTFCNREVNKTSIANRC